MARSRVTLARIEAAAIDRLSPSPPTTQRTRQGSGGAMPEPKSGAGYGNDAEELQKGDGAQESGEEKSA